MWFWLSRRTTKLGTLTTCLPTLCFVLEGKQVEVFSERGDVWERERDWEGMCERERDWEDVCERRGV
jgi:hypothetical protein